MGAGISCNNAKNMMKAPTNKTPAWMTSVQITAVIPPSIV